MTSVGFRVICDFCIRDGGTFSSCLCPMSNSILDVVDWGKGITVKARPGGCRDFCFDIVIRECYSVIAGGGDLLSCQCVNDNRNPDLLMFR